MSKTLAHNVSPSAFTFPPPYNGILASGAMGVIGEAPDVVAGRLGDTTGVLLLVEAPDEQADTITMAAYDASSVDGTPAATVVSNAAAGKAASDGLINGITFAGSGTYDPSVVGLAAPRPAVYVRDTEYLPKTLLKLNQIFEPYEATFSHAWPFQEAAGNAADLALAGGVALVPGNAPTQNVATALTDYVTDKAVEFADDTQQEMAPAAGASLDPGAGSLVLLWTSRLPVKPGGPQGVIGKGAKWYVRENADGTLDFVINDGVNSQSVTIAGDHSGAEYRDYLAVLDARDTMAFTSSLADGGTADPALVGTLANVGVKLSLGRIIGVLTAANQICTFLAWGIVPGTLAVDRVAALAAYTSARKAGFQFWGKYGAADTAWGR